MDFLQCACYVAGKELLQRHCSALACYIVIVTHLLVKLWLFEQDFLRFRGMTDIACAHVLA